MPIPHAAREERERLRAKGLKRCSRCYEVKGHCEFSKSFKAWDGLRSFCRACRADNVSTELEGYRARWASEDPHANAAPKRCHGCTQEMPRSNFAPNRSNSDGLQGTCLGCSAAREAARLARYRARWEASDANPYSDPSLKKCGACRQLRPRIDFSTNSSRSDGLQSYCKGCFAAYVASREARKRRQFVEHVDRSVAWDLAGGICYLCSRPCDPCRWDLDHVNPIVNGGEHSYFNTAPTHPSCNRRKNGTPWPDVSFDPAL